MAVSMRLSDIYNPQRAAATGKKTGVSLSDLIYAEAPAYASGKEREWTNALSDKTMAESTRQFDESLSLSKEISEINKSQAQKAGIIEMAGAGIGLANLAMKIPAISAYFTGGAKAASGAAATAAGAGAGTAAPAALSAEAAADAMAAAPTAAAWGPGLLASGGFALIGALAYMDSQEARGYNPTQALKDYYTYGHVLPQEGRDVPWPALQTEDQMQGLLREHITENMMSNEGRILTGFTQNPPIPDDGGMGSYGNRLPDELAGSLGYLSPSINDWVNEKASGWTAADFDKPITGYPGAYEISNALARLEEQKAAIMYQGGD